MKINISLDSLWSNVQQMGADTVSFDLGDVWDDRDIEFDKELSSSGVEINLEDLAPEQGLLSVKGRQVLLFIPDHSFRISDVLQKPYTGNKFHIADCSVLKKMRDRKRFERYKVTNNLSGVFDIYGSNSFGRTVEGKAELNVCKMCLNQLNYKGAANAGVEFRNNVVKQFDIAEFFSVYSSLFRHLPKQGDNKAKGYTEDWKDISSKTRKDAGYSCSKCSVDLSSNKRLLHVHHVNGVKDDNSPSNLITLCADCHKKEAFHDHIFIKHQDIQVINRLRREQKVIIPDHQDWQTVFQYADTAVHGILDHARNKGYSPPEVGYELTNDKGRVIAEVELGWPSTRFGVYIDAPEKEHQWHLLSLEQAMEFFSKRR